MIVCRTGDLFMKTVFVRLFMLVSLAAPLSFASSQAQPATATAVTTRQSGCPDAKESKKQKKEKQQKDQNPSGQEQEFERMLMGMFG
jgi:ribosomal protein L12E/L44/L45/RPP1/RPP2